MTETAYAKGPLPLPYSTDAGRLSLDLRVTLGDMPLADAFEINLSDVDPRLHIGDLLEQLFGPDGARDESIARRLDARHNPDLPEMYEALLDVFVDWRDNRCSLGFHRNHGPEMAPTDDLGTHLRASSDAPESNTLRSVRGDTQGSLRDGAQGSVRGEPVEPLPPLLDVVVEQLHTPLEYAAGLWYEGDLGLLVDRLQEHVLLYFASRLGYRLPAEPKSPVDSGVLHIAERLAEHGALTASDGLVYRLTEDAEERLDRADSEVKAAVRLYDLFADVVYDDHGRIEFGTGRGSDLRVDVYESEGLDSAETVLLRHLYDGTLDGLDADWREAVLDEDFFVELLIDLADREPIDADVLDAIVEAGFAHLEQFQEEAERDAQRRWLAARARRS